MDILKKIFVLVLAAGIAGRQGVMAQAGAGMKLGPKQQAYIDSIKKSDYKWIFPIWGKRLSAKGFDLQYPIGIGLNPFIASQKVIISDLAVGVNGNMPVPLNFIKFGEVKANIQTVNLRPDLWIFPFLDIYALGGATFTQTNVAITAPIAFSTKANFNGSTFGLGTTLAGGYHGWITIIDLNHTWTSLSNIQGSVQATNFAPRLGMSFPFKSDPAQSLAVWVGAQGIFINRTTEGSVNLDDLHSTASKPDLESIVNGSASWYQQLTPAQQIVVKQIAQKILDKINGIISNGVIINYSLKKRPQSDWSMSAGAQYQINHHWQVRSEVGFLGGRESLLISGNYRFRK